MLIAKAVLVSALLAASSNKDVPRQVTVAVGASTPLDLQLAGELHSCDDASVVRIDPAGDGKGWNAVGLKEGRTLCGFAENAKAQRIMLELIVIPAPKAGLPPKSE